jgi:beta-lactam-binding protein with PASTA domain
MNPTPASRRPIALFLLLVLGLWLAPQARADDPSVAVPDVVGRSAQEATTTLQAAGFEVDPVDIAAGTPGAVQSQVPPAGTYRLKGSKVEIRVGTAVRIQTTAPDVRGKSVEEATQAYAHAYVIEVELVPGDEAQQGKVVDQQPKPGSALLFRGVLRLFVVQEPTPAGVIVPSVIGKSEADARTMIEEAGLKVAVSYVQDPVADPGTVISQEPACCGEILAGGLVSLRVSGEAPPAPEADVVMPAVTGMTMHDASQVVLMAGLVPKVEFHVLVGQPAWRCVSQDPAAGQALASGSEVRLVVSLPSQSPTQVRVPPLYGLSGADAAVVLGLLHLQAQVVEQVSLYTPGRVFSQTPGSGTYVSTGSSVLVRVAKAPPPGWSPVGIQVPSVVGLTPAQAFVKLLTSGLWGHQRHHVSPGSPLGAVDAQHPAAGSVVGPGAKVTFFLPKGVTVPTLLGSTKAHALQKLLQVGLNASAHGPAFGLGTTKVTSQSVAPGTKIAEGSTVDFVYVYAGGVGPVLVKVPPLIGKTRPQAAALLQARGLNGQFLGPVLGLGPTKVTAQSPGPNTLVLAGSTVTVHYVHVGGVPVIKVKVPNVIGMTTSHATQVLQAKGLGTHLIGPAFGFGASKVTSQNPAPHTLVNPGSTVDVHYVYGGILQPLKVKVPALLGLTKGQAAAALQAKGLKAHFFGPAVGFGVPRVVAQLPASNTLVATGSTVKVTIKYTLAPGGVKVSVPNLINKTKGQALATLQAKGLSWSFHGPQFGFGVTKVVSQSPGPGVLVNPGTVVQVHYVFGAPLGIVKVKVPHVVGKTRAQAKAIIQAAGLKWKFVGPIFGIGVPHVISQTPHANVMVAKGSTVSMVVKFN